MYEYTLVFISLLWTTFIILNEDEYMKLLMYLIFY